MTTEASRDWRKALAAQSRGAAAILLLRDVHNRSDVADWAAAYARAAERGIRPRRTVVFAVLDAEERGPSLGAWHYTLRPPFPLGGTAAFINLDMIGRDQEVPDSPDSRFSGLEPQSAGSNANAVNVLGYSRSPQLAGAVEAANALTALTLRFRYDNNESNLLRRSDQWPFLQNGVPAVWFHTGLHPDTTRERTSRSGSTTRR